MESVKKQFRDWYAANYSKEQAGFMTRLKYEKEKMTFYGAFRVKAELKLEQLEHQKNTESQWSRDLLKIDLREAERLYNRAEYNYLFHLTD